MLVFSSNFLCPASWLPWLQKPWGCKQSPSYAGPELGGRERPARGPGGRTAPRPTVLSRAGQGHPGTCAMATARRGVSGVSP